MMGRLAIALVTLPSGRLLARKQNTSSCVAELTCCCQFKRTHTHTLLSHPLKPFLHFTHYCRWNFSPPPPPPPSVSGSLSNFPNFPPPSLACRATVLMLCHGSFQCVIGVCLFLCVCVCGKEWERGEADGSAHAAQRQLPRERRPQGKNRAMPGHVMLLPC